jgi:Ca-activated chloride channel homolog
MRTSRLEGFVAIEDRSSPLGPRLSALGLALFAMLLLASDARAQSGVLIPSSVSDGPDATKIELTEMTVGVKVDRQLARTRVLQIFANRTNRPIEATFVFAIPTSASIADFAVWDGDVRIPGVIIEKRKARRLYEEIAAQAIDPGLLEQEGEEEAPTAFTVRVAPVPAYGTKRIELEYTELLPVDGLQSYYSFPLKPSEYGEQKIGHLRIDVQILSGFALTPLVVQGSQYAVAVDRQEEFALESHFEAVDVTPAEDFAFTYGINVPRSALDVVAYRAPERISADEVRDPARADKNPDGYFQAGAIFNGDGRAPGAASAPHARSVVLMLDVSLSMNGEKLDRAYEAVEYFLGALRPEDRFNLLLFNDDVLQFAQEPAPGSPDQIEKALGFVRASYLSGGTDLQGALARAAEAAAKLPAAGGERAVVMITDGNPTLTAVETRKVVDEFVRRNGASAKARLEVFGVGSDTRVGLLAELASATGGQFVWSRETEDIAFKLKAFFAKVGLAPLDGLALAVQGGEVYQVYPDRPTTGYDGSALHFVGRYKKPGPASFMLRGNSAKGAVELRAEASLPERDDTHAEVPRLWARARVDFLLRQIDLNGETEAAIDEIIALSKKFKFVTPYTSFLAAPRSLLRPRTIRPGDPILRVKTDESIASVVAVFPFGLVKQMRRLAGESLWETRFLAPSDLADGQYQCRLVMTDTLGRSFQEIKRFRVDSRPPVLSATVEPSPARAGQDVRVVVRADADTRWITARLFGAAPTSVRWDAAAKANVATVRVPAGLPPGVYTIEIVAEDFAHNSASTAVRVEVSGS